LAFIAVECLVLRRISAIGPGVAQFQRMRCQFEPGAAESLDQFVLGIAKGGNGLSGLGDNLDLRQSIFDGNLYLKRPESVRCERQRKAIAINALGVGDVVCQGLRPRRRAGIDSCGR